MRRRIIIGSSLLMGVAIVLAFTLTRPRAPLRVLVSFSGATNGTTGTQLATFRIANQSGLTIHLAGTYLVNREKGPDMVFSFGPNVLLTNNQVEMVAISPPTNGTPWRVVFICSPDEWRRRLNDRIGPSRFMDLIPDPIRVAPGQRFESAWIDK